MRNKFYNNIFVIFFVILLTYVLKKRIRFYLKRRKYYKRINKFRKITVNKPDSIEAAGAYYTIGLIYQNNLEQYEDAVKEYENVIGTGSELADSALYKMARCYEALGDYLNAKKTFFDVLRRFPDSSRCEDAQYRLDELTLKDE